MNLNPAGFSLNRCMDSGLCSLHLSKTSKTEICRPIVVVLSLSLDLMVLTTKLAFVSAYLFFVFYTLLELGPVALP